MNSLDAMKRALLEALKVLSALVAAKKKPMPPTLPPDLPPDPPAEVLVWDSPEHVRHSARVIMDEMGLTGVVDPDTGLSAKDLLTSCLWQESEYNPKAVGKQNLNGTTDYGLAQFNNGKNAQGQAYWIGPGAVFFDVAEVLDNPAKNVRIMVQEYKAGRLKRWSSYSTGAYKRWFNGRILLV